jgi:hypothetical protein
MAHFLCRLINADGTVRSVVPISSSSKADALTLAWSFYEMDGVQVTCDLWMDNIRIVAHVEMTGKLQPPHQR